MFEKLLDSIEKLLNLPEKYKEEQAKKLSSKRASYLEKRRQEVERETKEAAMKMIHDQNAEKRKKLGSFTTVEEFKNIVESGQYKKLSDKEKEIFLKRMNELRKKDTKFAADYQAWQNEKAQKRKTKVTITTVRASKNKVYHI